MVFYQCTYIHRSGEICNQECYHLKGYHIHRNSPSQVPCNEYRCNKLTYGRYGFCNIHTKKYHKREQYHQKKLADLALMQKVVGK